MDCIYIYTRSFSDFSTSAHEAISNIPADQNDQFALVVAQGSSGRVGFNASDFLFETFSRLIGKTEELGAKNQKPISYDFFSGKIYVKKNNDSLDHEIRKYEKIKIYRKKMEILERNGKDYINAPPALLEPLLDGKKFSKEIYFFLLNNCDYCIFVYPSTEHGRFTIYAFSRDLKIFFGDLRSCLNNVEIKLISDSRKIPCN